LLYQSFRFNLDGMNTIEKHHPDGIALDCHPCSIDQARGASRMAGLNAEETEQIIAVADNSLKESKTTALLVQHIVRRIADAIIQLKKESPDYDIYSLIKEESNRLAQNSKDRFQDIIDKSVSPLEKAIQISAAANIIDFGANHSVDVENELLSLTEVPFNHYDIDAFRETLSESETLLYLCDNCGEIVFDMPLIREIQKEYPQVQITAVFREKPIINDATLADAQAVGFTSLVPCISSGSVYPGTVLSETSDEFKALYKSADMIISKGQGNYETLLPIADKRTFFLLRIKCEYMALLSNVGEGNLVLMQGQNP
jgi:damage-control phosphatase, subfamily I